MIKAAVRAVRARTTLVPDVAVILGTGLGGLADAMVAEARLPYSAIPGFPLSPVKGAIAIKPSSPRCGVAAA